MNLDWKESENKIWAEDEKVAKLGGPACGIKRP